MTNLPAQVKEFIRGELHGTYTVSFAIIEVVDHENQRVEVSLKDDREVIIDNIPVASPYAGDGYGEVYPIREGEEGLLLISKEPTDEILQGRSHVDVPKQRQHSYQDGIFFPQIWFDPDTVPNHAPGDYLMAHESGTNVWIKANGDYLVEHHTGPSFRMEEHADRDGEHLRFDSGGGTFIDLDTFPEPDEELKTAHNIEWPEQQPDAAEHVTIAHRSGIAAELTDDGIHLSTIEDDLDTEPYQRPEDTRSAHGELTDPYRIEMNDHRHLVPDETGENFYLSGPPLNHRLLFDTLLGPTRSGQILNFATPQVTDLVEYYGNYHQWLQTETGETLDPEIPRDVNGYPDYAADPWTDVEPVPDGEQRMAWWPINWQ